MSICIYDLDQDFSNFLVMQPILKIVFLCDLINGWPWARDTNDTCKLLLKNFKGHFCLWWSHKNAHNPL